VSDGLVVVGFGAKLSGAIAAVEDNLRRMRQLGIEP
jgi:hypothetical protein